MTFAVLPRFLLRAHEPELRLTRLRGAALASVVALLCAWASAPNGTATGSSSAARPQPA